MSVLNGGFHENVVAIAAAEEFFDTGQFFTGFVLIRPSDENHYLVTVTDAIKAGEKTHEKVYVRGASYIGVCSIDLAKTRIITHEFLPLAVIKLPPGCFGERKPRAVVSTDLLVDPQEAKVSDGDMVLIPGFMHLTEGFRDWRFPVVRGGVVARINAMYIEEQTCFLVDSALFAGYEGAPVWLRPWPYVVKGTHAQDLALVLGIVLTFLWGPRGPNTEIGSLGWVAPSKEILKVMDGFNDAIQEIPSLS